MIANGFGNAATATAAAALIACLVWIAVRLCRLLEVRTRAEQTRGAMLRLDYAVTSVVLELQQVAVRALKSGARSGKKLGRQVSAMLQKTAHARVKQYLGTRGVAALAATMSLDAPTFDQLIATRIEAAVYDLQRKRRTPGTRRTATPRPAR